MQCRRDCEKHAQGIFSSSLHSDRSAIASRPKSAAADFVEQALVHRSGTAIPLRSRWWIVSRSKRDGGAGGIRTLDTAFQPYNGLANRRLQPLGHSTISSSAALLTEGLCW